MGMLRVISQMKKVTLDKKEVRNNLNFEMLANHGTHVTTELCAKGDYESSRMWTASNVNFMRKHAVHRGQALAMANYAQENVALDHAMNRQLQTESARLEEQLSFTAPSLGGGGGIMNGHGHFDGFGGVGAAGPPPSVLQHSGARKKMGKKRKMKSRTTERNDTFSSHMYKMKSKSKK